MEALSAACLYMPNSAAGKRTSLADSHSYGHPLGNPFMPVMVYHRVGTHETALVCDSCRCDSVDWRRCSFDTEWQK